MGCYYRCLLLTIATAFLTPAYAVTTADQWNLSDIYPSVAAWKADADRADAQLKELAGCKGHMGDNAARLKQCLDLQADVTKRYRRLAVFSSEQAAGDTGLDEKLPIDSGVFILVEAFDEEGDGHVRRYRASLADGPIHYDVGYDKNGRIFRIRDV